jgi:hypothetical protein
MKKKIVISLLFLSLLCMYLPSYSVYALTNKPVQDSKEDLYKNISLSLLMPYIDKSIDDYYTKFLDQKPSVDPWDINVLSVERLDNFFAFVIKMEVYPYVGSHIRVGADRITITVNAVGSATINNFEHIKSTYLELPPNWQHIIRKNPNFN